jgi:hypothetical protein
MPPSSDPKRSVGAHVRTKVHFAMSAMDSKRTFGSAWNSLVSGTVMPVVEHGSGKRVSVSVDVMWDLPDGRKARVVNVRSGTAGDAPGIAVHAAGASRSTVCQVVGADAEQDSERRDWAPPAYSEAGTLAPPDQGDSLATATEWTAHGILWEERGCVGAGWGSRFPPPVVF